MAYNPFPSGQKVMSSSAGVVIASDQSPVSVAGTVIVTGLQGHSVAGTVGASIIGQLPAGTAPLGSIAALQGTNPWIINGSVSGTVGASVIGNVNTTITSIATVGQVMGSVATLQGTNPWITTFSNSSIVALQLAGSVLATSATINTGNSSVMLLNGPNVIGSVTALQGTNPWNISSVYGNVSGSVVAFQGAGWSGSVAATIIGTPNVNTAGSVVAFQGGTWRPSTAAMYATGAASIVSALGDLVLGARNDTLASIFATANAQYSPFTAGSWGDQIVSFAPSSVWTSGIASCFTGVEQPVIVSVLGRRVNVTSIQMTNQSANNVYLSFYGAGIGSVTGSIIGFSAVPASGGSNITFPIPLQTANNSGFSASVSGVASVYLSAQGFYSAV